MVIIKDDMISNMQPVIYDLAAAIQWQYCFYGGR